MLPEDSIIALKGIGDKTASLFQKLNITTIRDLLQYYPKGYHSYEAPILIAQCKEGERCCIKVQIQSHIEMKRIHNRIIVTCSVTDESGRVKVIWYNMPFLRKQLHVGQTLILVGTFRNYRNQLELCQPDIYTKEQYEQLCSTLQPQYGLVKGITNKTISKAVTQALKSVDSLDDYLPESIRAMYCLPDYNTMVHQIHFGTTLDEVRQARQRIVFDEFFSFMLKMNRLKEENLKEANCYPILDCEEYHQIIASLPYELTNAQKRTLDEIRNDVKGEFAMNRLVQGDVGSGKTIVAILALVLAVKSGYQGALMAPTEVLASQHYESFIEICKSYHIKAALLTGSVKASEKRKLYAEIASGDIQVVIGTHALIQKSVVYHNLGLVITDEQHRFGVKQRKDFAKKGGQPHVLVMSATPIPRTLAIILYGDLDISVMNELPANRLPIKNCVIGTQKRITAYQFLQKEVEKKHQAYVICPMVEDSDALDAENVMDYTDVLKQHLPASYRIAYLHGSMSAEEKLERMDAFINKTIDILVSTTVIEVGINNPNATVIMIENAERFGLAQLHQLRGRVGRGSAQSYCIMVCGNETKDALDRLQVVASSNDGFVIANEDLRLRGPGEFFGNRQSGDVLFQMADIYADANILKAANEAIRYCQEKNVDLTEVYQYLDCVEAAHQIAL